MFRHSVVVGAAAAVALLSGAAFAAETFTPAERQLFDVDQPGPRGDIASWSYQPPPGVNAIRTCAQVMSLDGHRLFAPAFSIVLIAGDEVLRLRLINEDRRSILLPAYLRRERADDPEQAVLTGSRRKPSKREVKMQSIIQVGQPFDLGLTWAEEGKVDVMIRTGGREEHILVPMLNRPDKIRVISSSGYWRLAPFYLGAVEAGEPDPDARNILSPPGCPGATSDYEPAAMDPAEENDEG